VFVLTVVVDLTVAVEFGLVAAALTFIYRISSLSRIEEVPPQTLEEVRNRDWAGPVHAYRLYGALFFGAVRLVESLSEPLRAGEVLVIDLKNLIYMDTSGSDALLALRRQCEQKGIEWVLIGLSHQPLDMARRAGLIQTSPTRS
jgi:SulP family sulfate permease